MKTFVILVSICALATASPAFPFSEDESSETNFDEDSPAGDVQDVLDCIGKAYAEMGSDFTTGDILECVPEWRSEDQVLGINGNPNYVDFIVKAKGTDKSFKIGNSQLSRGKWIHDHQKVRNVDDLRVSNSRPAEFRASSSSGCQGKFTIFRKSKAITKVTFDIPSKGKNSLEIKQYRNDYRCAVKGFTKYGSPTIKISCGSATNVGETEEYYDDVEYLLDDRMALELE